MKFLACLLLLSIAASAEAYPFMIVRYDYSTVGGVTSLNVYLHNNGGKTASCEVTVFNRSQRVTVYPTGDEKVSFSSLPEGAQPRYACEVS